LFEFGKDAGAQIDGRCDGRQGTYFGAQLPHIGQELCAHSASGKMLLDLGFGYDCCAVGDRRAGFFRGADGSGAVAMAIRRAGGCEVIEHLTEVVAALFTRNRHQTASFKNSTLSIAKKFPLTFELVA
jgi:hypothetical protein